MLDATTIDTRKPRPAFARWLLNQAGRSDQIGDLAKAARRDPAFPVDGDYNAVSKRLNEVQADGEMHGALDDAELDWSAY